MYTYRWSTLRLTTVLGGSLGLESPEFTENECDGKIKTLALSVTYYTESELLNRFVVEMCLPVICYRRCAIVKSDDRRMFYISYLHDVKLESKFYNRQ